ncbi:MAG TPA: RNA 2',3'-cyclic phosphodiesterase [Pyrinomonadaceae bacterium]|jgi:2'-5' RNA ligase
MNDPETEHTTARTTAAPSDASSLRLFCAITLSQDVRTRAAEHIAHLRDSLPRVRVSWERTEKLHITLKFFGDVEPSRTGSLSGALTRAANTVNAFNLLIQGAGTFPTHGNPRVLWLGVQDSSGTLTRLHQSLEDECALSGFKRDERPFHPHITLARLRQPAGTRPLAALHQETGFPALELNVNGIVLMKSELGRGGSCYTVLSHHRLG